MINHELVKKLKEAGFPMENYCGNYGCCICHGEDVSELKPPTLSELIEACGDEFRCLEKMSHQDLWFAKTYQDSPVYDGKTPEEAVAKLWLKLNETSKQKE